MRRRRGIHPPKARTRRRRRERPGPRPLLTLGRLPRGASACRRRRRRTRGRQQLRPVRRRRRARACGRARLRAPSRRHQRRRHRLARGRRLLHCTWWLAPHRLRRIVSFHCFSFSGSASAHSALTASARAVSSAYRALSRVHYRCLGSECCCEWKPRSSSATKIGTFRALSERLHGDPRWRRRSHSTMPLTTMRACSGPGAARRSGATTRNQTLDATTSRTRQATRDTGRRPATSAQGARPNASRSRVPPRREIYANKRARDRIDASRKILARRRERREKKRGPMRRRSALSSSSSSVWRRARR